MPPKKEHNEITQKMLLDVLDYNPATGVFKWKKPGRDSSIFHEGTKTVAVYGKMRRPRDIAWCYVLGVWPCMCLIHKDGDRTNLKFSNLQLSERSRPRIVGSNMGSVKVRRNINTIKNGTWEDKHYKCPPATYINPQELFGEKKKRASA